jgi:hypothetical protein
MIHRSMKFGLIFIIIAIPLIGCTTTTPAREDNGIFYTTRDINQAQDKVPFTIIAPDYIPEMQGEMTPPSITMTLNKKSNSGKAKIELLYPLPYSNMSYIQLIECNYVYTSGDPELNPELEIVNIQGKQVVRYIRNEYSTFYFNENGIYYILDCHDVPVEEAEKVLESMLKQL